MLKTRYSFDFGRFSVERDYLL